MFMLKLSYNDIQYLHLLIWFESDAQKLVLVAFNPCNVI